LAHQPAQLILASKSEQKINEVIASLVIPSETVVRSLSLDLSSFKAVRAAAAQVSEWVASIDGLICTAGIMATSTYQTSVDGFELQFAINHLGHFLFTNLLIEKLLAAPGGPTVVNYTSSAHSHAKMDFLDDLSYGSQGDNYNKWLAYSNSKACNILFSVGLVQRFGARGLRSFGVDPGVIVTTSLTRSVPPEDFIALGELLTRIEHLLVSAALTCSWLGWVDEQGKLSSAIKTKTSAEGSSSAIIATFDKTLTSKRDIYDIFYNCEWKLTEGLMKMITGISSLMVLSPTLA
jgi:NAD(P)-dependent dehydrogenase (short-subunit alcohol dehydrogenase family)